MQQRFNKATPFSVEHRFVVPFECGVAPIFALSPRLHIIGKSIVSVATRGHSTVMARRLHPLALHGRISAGLVLVGALFLISILALLLFEMLRLHQDLLGRRGIAGLGRPEALMRANDRMRPAELARIVFGTLLTHSEGLSVRAILANVERSLPTAGSARSGQPGRPAISGLEDLIGIETVALIKAGWLLKNRDVWCITESGRLAYAEFEDPERFMIEAGRLSLKGRLSICLPRLYYLAGLAKDQLKIEYKMSQRIGWSILFGNVVGASGRWQEILPLQSPKRFIIPGLHISKVEDLLDYLDSLGVAYAEGGHTIYLPPASVQQTAFRILIGNYPPNIGIKIVKNQGGIDDSTYVYPAQHSRMRDSLIHNRLTHHHRHLSLVANLLFSKGLGPRLYDLVELQCGETLWTAYVSEHVGDRTPSNADYEKGLDRIHSLEQDGSIRVTTYDGYDADDFRAPDCNNNAFVDDNGTFRYVDFQNFLLVDYESFLKETAAQAVDSSHFGGMSLLRGGRYLYQSVPGIRLPGKRNTDERVRVLRDLMQSAGVSLEERLVLDFGCNIGMMMAQYLKLGARWCHGWDRADIIPFTEKLLLAVGCTRFSLTGGDISRSQKIEAEVPRFLTPHLNGCVISYLAMHAHVRWVDALARIPWAFLIYEGHESETQEEFERNIEQLRAVVDFKLDRAIRSKDGDCQNRNVAILLRKGRAPLPVSTDPRMEETQ